MSGKKQWIVLAGLALGATTAGVASANPQVFMEETDAWGNSVTHLTDGGPFQARAENWGFTPAGIGEHGADDDSFITFCIERHEFLEEGERYDVQFSDAADNGGQGSGNTDPLDDETAWLYAAFQRGTLDEDTSFVYDTDGDENGDDLNGSALQEAIYWIEGEYGSMSEGDSALADLAWELVDAAQAAIADGWTNNGRVKVINTWGEGSNFSDHKQDMLVLVPLPAPLLLGLAGLAGVGVSTYRRRRNASEV